MENQTNMVEQLDKMESPLEDVDNLASPNPGEKEALADIHTSISEENEPEISDVDYSTFKKHDFANLLKSLVQDEHIRKSDRIVRDIRNFIDDIREKERNVALNKFIEDGGKTEDFSYRNDEDDLMIDSSIRLIRDRRQKFNKEQEESRKQNLIKKEELLVRLREVVEKEDSASNFADFKRLQTEWKSIGAVPASHVKSLWASYNALIDRFYDHRNIYFELKELDRRKNLEAKMELCIRAERLTENPSLSKALVELNELHHEFRHIGPVPLADKEILWSRFKAASDAVYHRRDEHLKEINQKLKNNLDQKLAIIEKIMAYSSFESSMIKEWNSKTQELIEIQKAWTAIGPVNRLKTKDINKKFWTAFKLFFNNKAHFFKKLDAERESNLQKKRELVEKALQLRESEDWNHTAEQIKQLQREWKEIGPVPEKVRTKIYDEFKDACDFFFNRRRDSFDKIDKEQEENQREKEHICEEIEKLAEAGQNGVDRFKELAGNFYKIGYVPKKAVQKLRERFDKASAHFIETLPDGGIERDKLSLEVSLMGIKNDPEAEKKIFHREQVLRKKIQKVENDMAILKNNLEFFGRSKNADKYRDEFQAQINEAGIQLSSLKSQLKLIKASV